MVESIYYLTYQDFPSRKANTIQTISTVSQFSRNGLNVKLFFPLRSKNSNDNINDLQTFYGFQESFDIKGIEHNHSFEKYKFFNRAQFFISHFTWTMKAVRYVLNNYSRPSFFFTRSELVFLVLSIKNLPVVFECHQMSITKKLALKISLLKQNSKVIFLNKYVAEQTKPRFNNQILIQSNGFDLQNILPSDQKRKYNIVYSGSLKQLNTSRNFNFIYECFNDERLSNILLNVIGDDDLVADKYRKNKNIVFHGYKDRKEALELVNQFEVGLLIGNSDSKLSSRYTSPLKFFEYCGLKLKVVAVDFLSHRNLPFQENIYYFKENDSESFINAVSNSFLGEYKEMDLNEHSLKIRVENIIYFLEN